MEYLTTQLPDDPEIRGSLPALRRAAIHARELAEHSGTPCWIMRDGRIVDAISGREAPLQPPTVAAK